MSLAPDVVKKIAHLARLNISDNETETYVAQLSSILNFIEQMNQTNTDHVEPLAHPLATTQRVRADEVTAENLRDKFQQIAPQTEAGLYLVPKVIDEA